MVLGGQNTKDNNLTAIGYMLVAVFLYSLVPFLFEKGGSADAPGLFFTIWKFTSFAGSLLFLYIFYKEFFSSMIVRQLIAKNLFTWILFFSIINHLDTAAFAYATAYIDIAIVSILYEIWPIFFALYIPYIKSKISMQRNDFAIWKGGLKKFTRHSYFLLLFGFAGSVFIIASKYGTINFVEESEYKNMIIGVSLSVTGMILAALSANGIVWGEILSYDYEKKCKQLSPQDNEFKIYEKYTHKKKKYMFPIDVLFVIAGYVISSFFAFVINLIFNLLQGSLSNDISVLVEKNSIFDFIFAAIIGGFIVGVIGTIFWRISNLISKNYAINSMMYSIPMIAILWLWLANAIDLHKPDFLLIGSMIIVIINLLINFTASVRFGYQILIISLWSFGTIIYLHDGIELDKDSYFNIITIVSTLYILVLSFRLDRFVRRTSDEEQRTLTLLENITKLITSNKLIKDTRNLLINIDAPQNIYQLRQSYDGMKTFLFNAQQKAHDDNDDVLVDKLAKIESEVEILALSKQQGNNFGELLALMILGAITIGVLVFTYPIGLCGNKGISVEIFAILLSAIVAFLFVNILDLQKDRNAPIIREKKGTEKKQWRFGIVFRDLEDRNFERWLSFIICIVIIGVYVGLLYYKWIDMPC